MEPLHPPLRVRLAPLAFAAAVLLCPLSGVCAEDSDPPEAPAIAGDVCADGQSHNFRLNENRDRLIRSLAAEKGVEVCALWASLSLAERDLFKMVTAYLGSCESRLAAPPSTSDETALDHAQKLYSINAPGLADVTAAPVPSGGGACGGYDSNRVFIGFDATAVNGMRASHESLGQPWGGPLNPKHNRGYNWWRASNDAGGAHTPFTDRDMICWGGLLPCWVRFANSEGPTWHFFAKDGDAVSSEVQQGLRNRRGVCGVQDPYLAELTVAFNWDHESDPLCDAKDWMSKFIKKIGPDSFKAYAPTDAGGNGCRARPVNNDPKGGNTHAGLGPDIMDRTCLGTVKAAPAAVDPAKVNGLIEKITGSQLP
jgi:hypothetical protein